MILLPLWFVAISAFIAAVACLIRFVQHKNWMDIGRMATRLFLCYVYVWFILTPSLSIEETRVWGRLAIALLCWAEIFYTALDLLIKKQVGRIRNEH